jgi:hypothetical protein
MSAAGQTFWYQHFRSIGFDLCAIILVWVPGGALEIYQVHDAGFRIMLIWSLLGLVAGIIGAWGGEQWRVLHAILVAVMLIATRIVVTRAQGHPLSVGSDLLPGVFAVLGGLVQWVMSLTLSRLRHWARQKRQAWVYETSDGRRLRVFSPPSFSVASHVVSGLAIGAFLLIPVCFVVMLMDGVPLKGSHFIPMIFIGIGCWCWRWAKKLDVSLPSRKFVNDGRPFVLYLRSFLDDTDGNIDLDGRKPSLTTEQRVAAAFGELGTVIAIGHPGEALPILGAQRFYVEGEDWREVVRDLLTRAHAVVLRAGCTPGLRWELEQVVRSTPPEKRVLFLSFVASMTASRQTQYHEFCRWAGSFWGTPLPAEIGTSLMIYFDKSDRPRLLDPSSVADLEGHPLVGPLSRLAKDEQLRILAAATRRDTIRLIAGLVALPLGLALGVLAMKLTWSYMDEWSILVGMVPAVLPVVFFGYCKRSVRKRRLDV